MTREQMLVEIRRHNVHPQRIGIPRRHDDEWLVEVQFQEEPDIGPIFVGRGVDKEWAELDALRKGLEHFRTVDRMDGRR